LKEPETQDVADIEIFREDSIEKSPEIVLPTLYGEIRQRFFWSFSKGIINNFYKCTIIFVNIFINKPSTSNAPPVVVSNESIRMSKSYVLLERIDDGKFH
jgi:hypothetical protein